MWSIHKRLVKLKEKLERERERKRAAQRPQITAVPPLLMLPAPQAAPPPEPEPLQTDIYVRKPIGRPRGSYARRDTAVLNGYYGFNAPNPLPQGSFAVSADSPFRLHCWCGRHYWPKEGEIRHNNWPEIQVENYTINCPGCERDLICCGFDKLQAAPTPSAEEIESRNAVWHTEIAKAKDAAHREGAGQ